MEDFWYDVLEPQWLDLLLLAVFFTLAMVSFFKKSALLKYVTMGAAVGYLGLWKSNLVGVVDIFRIFSWNVPIFKYALAWYLFFGFALVSTVIWGRIYCGRVCAFGALTQL